eukprot:COSAG06_NODE_12192_length_1411_cov_2.179116_1_plen_72_part_10
MEARFREAMMEKRRNEMVRMRAAGGTVEGAGTHDLLSPPPPPPPPPPTPTVQSLPPPLPPPPTPPPPTPNCR